VYGTTASVVIIGQAFELTAPVRTTLVRVADAQGAFAKVLEISTYRLLLQEEANFPTHGGFVVWIGPEGDPQIHKTLDLRDRIQYYLNKKQNNEL